MFYRGHVVELSQPDYEKADKAGLLKLIELAHAKSVEICKTANRLFAVLQILGVLLLCVHLGVAAMSGQVRFLGLEITVNQEYLATLAVVVTSALYVMYIGALSYSRKLLDDATDKLIILGVPIAGKDWDEQYLIGGHLLIDFMLDHGGQILSQSLPRMLFQVVFIFVKIAAKVCIAVFPFAVACLYATTVLNNQQGWVTTTINLAALAAVPLFWIDMYRHENIRQRLEMKERGGKQRLMTFQKIEKSEQTES